MLKIPSLNTMKIISIFAALFHFIGLLFIAPNVFNNYNPYMGIVIYIQYGIMTVFFTAYVIRLFRNSELNTLVNDQIEDTTEKEQTLLNRINTSFYIKEMCVLDLGMLLGTILFIIVDSLFNI